MCEVKWFFDESGFGMSSIQTLTGDPNTGLVQYSNDLFRPDMGIQLPDHSRTIQNEPEQYNSPPASEASREVANFN
jgi:hypothetical protein